MFKQMRTIIAFTVLVAFIGSSIQVPAYAQMAFDNQLPWMPKPGMRVGLSPVFTPAVLKGITVHPENPLMFDFIIYKGEKVLTVSQKQDEYKKLIKYFLASLAIPDEDQWVNLSPYEKDRIIKDDFGKTLMGRDLLAQDYILKQITASLIYPEDKLGKKFWADVYAKAQHQYGTTNIPVNTFNKVWIIPDNALIYEKGNTAYVLKNHLKVMLEEDYLALSHNVIPAKGRIDHSQLLAGIQNKNNINALGSQVVREIVLPALEREVNEGKNFAMLRQVYSGMLLAAWFKRTLRKSILGQIYADKTKVKGIEQDPKNNEAIYQRYLRAYKKGVFNYIKEDVDRFNNENIPRKYFSGGTESYNDPTQGVNFDQVVKTTRKPAIGDEAMRADEAQLVDVTAAMDKAMARPLGNWYSPPTNPWSPLPDSMLDMVDYLLRQIKFSNGYPTKDWHQFSFLGKFTIRAEVPQRSGIFHITLKWDYYTKNFKDLKLAILSDNDEVKGIADLRDLSDASGTKQADFSEFNLPNGDYHLALADQRGELMYPKEISGQNSAMTVFRPENENIFEFAQRLAKQRKAGVWEFEGKRGLVSYHDTVETILEKYTAIKRVTDGHQDELVLPEGNAVDISDYASSLLMKQHRLKRPVVGQFNGIFLVALESHFTVDNLVSEYFNAVDAAMVRRQKVNIQKALARQGKEKLTGLNQVQVAELIGASQSGVSVYLDKHDEAYAQYGIIKGKYSINNAMTAEELNKILENAVEIHRILLAWFKKPDVDGQLLQEMNDFRSSFDHDFRGILSEHLPSSEWESWISKFYKEDTTLTHYNSSTLETMFKNKWVLFTADLAMSHVPQAQNKPDAAMSSGDKTRGLRHLIERLFGVAYVKLDQNKREHFVPNIVSDSQYQTIGIRAQSNNAFYIKNRNGRFYFDNFSTPAIELGIHFHNNVKFEIMHDGLRVFYVGIPVTVTISTEDNTMGAKKDDHPLGGNDLNSAMTVKTYNRYSEFVADVNNGRIHRGSKIIKYEYSSGGTLTGDSFRNLGIYGFFTTKGWYFPDFSFRNISVELDAAMTQIKDHALEEIKASPFISHDLIDLLIANRMELMNLMFKIKSRASEHQIEIYYNDVVNNLAGIATLKAGRLLAYVAGMYHHNLKELEKKATWDNILEMLDDMEGQLPPPSLVYKGEISKILLEIEAKTPNERLDFAKEIIGDYRDELGAMGGLVQRMDELPFNFPVQTMSGEMTAKDARELIKKGGYKLGKLGHDYFLFGINSAMSSPTLQNKPKDGAMTTETVAEDLKFFLGQKHPAGVVGMMKIFITVVNQEKAKLLGKSTLEEMKANYSRLNKVLGKAYADNVIGNDLFQLTDLLIFPSVVTTLDESIRLKMLEGLDPEQLKKFDGLLKKAMNAYTNSAMTAMDVQKFLDERGISVNLKNIDELPDKEGFEIRRAVDKLNKWTVLIEGSQEDFINHLINLDPKLGIWNIKIRKGAKTNVLTAKFRLIFKQLDLSVLRKLLNKTRTSGIGATVVEVESGVRKKEHLNNVRLDSPEMPVNATYIQGENDAGIQRKLDLKKTFSIQFDAAMTASQIDKYVHIFEELFSKNKFRTKFPTADEFAGLEGNWNSYKIRYSYGQILAEVEKRLLKGEYDDKPDNLRVRVELSVNQRKEELNERGSGKKKPSDNALLAQKPGGIDLNSANLSMMIKRDGKGVVLPLAQQDLAQLSNIEGLDPIILSIKPASETPVFAQL